MDAWPPSLRAYVSRAFAAADALDSGSDHHSRREAERFLRDRITQADKSSTESSQDRQILTRPFRSKGFLY